MTLSTPGAAGNLRRSISLSERRHEERFLGDGKSLGCDPARVGCSANWPGLGALENMAFWCEARFRAERFMNDNNNSGCAWEHQRTCRLLSAPGPSRLWRASRSRR